jgi:hypothetical protein
MIDSNKINNIIEEYKTKTITNDEYGMYLKDTISSLIDFSIKMTTISAISSNISKERFDILDKIYVNETVELMGLLQIVRDGINSIIDDKV